MRFIPSRSVISNCADPGGRIAFMLTMTLQAKAQTFGSNFHAGKTEKEDCNSKLLEWFAYYKRFQKLFSNDAS